MADVLAAGPQEAGGLGGEFVAAGSLRRRMRGIAGRHPEWNAETARVLSLATSDEAVARTCC